MLTLCLAAAVAAAQTSASAPTATTPASPFSYSVLYDIQTRATIPVVGARIGTLPHFLGKNLQPEVWALGGLNLTTSRPDLGFATVFPYKFADNATAFFGGAVIVENDKPTSLGIVAGFQFSFGN